jgi:hypothetical protein
MNHAKIAAALHALADAFLADVEAVEQAVTGQKGKAKAPSAESAASAPVAPVTAAAVPAPVEPAPVVPTITKDQLNKVVLKVAAKSRDIAEAVLAKFGAKNTVTLPQEQWQAVYDAFEEEIAKLDAAAVQVAQASLV